MTLLFFDGFETGIPMKPEWVGSPNIQNGRSGSGMGNANTLSITASAQVTVGFAWYATSTTYSSTVTQLVAFLCDAGATAHLSVGVDSNSATPKLTLRRGNATGTLLATSAQTYPVDSWRSVEVQATIADSGGRCIVKVDGTTYIDFTGDTRNAGTSTDIDRLVFTGSSSGGGVNMRWDDLWVCDGVDATATQGRANNTFLGDLKVTGLLPNGNGASSQFTGSDGNSTDNYLLVDETGTPNTSDWVGSSTPGQRDLYLLPDLQADATTVYGVRTHNYVAKSDAGAIGMKSLLRTGDATVHEDMTMAALSTTYLNQSGPLRATYPGTTTPWTVSDVNALQSGVEATA